MKNFDWNLFAKIAVILVAVTMVMVVVKMWNVKLPEIKTPEPCEFTEVSIHSVFTDANISVDAEPIVDEIIHGNFVFHMDATRMWIEDTSDNDMPFLTFYRGREGYWQENETNILYDMSTSEYVIDIFPVYPDEGGVVFSFYKKICP